MSDTENSGLMIPKFRFVLTAEDEICLNCTAPGKLCTGGEGMCPIGCQFYKKPPPDFTSTSLSTGIPVIREAIE